MMATVALAAVNSIIVVVLLFLYGKIVLRTKAMYAAGLVFFAIMLLAHNAVTIYAYVAMALLFGAEAIPYLMGMSALELAGLIVLVWITL